mgnify:CR=1 FL=1
MLKKEQDKNTFISPYVVAGTFNAVDLKNNRLNKEIILRSICKYLGEDFNKVKNLKSRLSNLVYARMLYGYFCRIYTNESYEKIANFIHKDHASVIHYVKKIEGFRSYDKAIQIDVKRLNNEFSYKVVNLKSDELERIGIEIMKKYARPNF